MADVAVRIRKLRHARPILVELLIEELHHFALRISERARVVPIVQIQTDGRGHELGDRDKPHKE